MLVVLILLPLMALFVGLAVELAKVQRALIEHSRTSVARMLSATADREVAQYVGRLEALAGSPALAAGDLEEFARHATTLVGSANILRVWLVSADGALFGVPAPAATDRQAEPEADLRASAIGGEIAVSTVRGEGLDSAYFTVSVPVRADVKPPLALAMDVRAGFLSKIIARDPGMGATWVSAIVDRTNHFVARSLDSERRVGQVARPELGVAALSPEPEGVFRNFTYEGAEMLDSYHRSRRTGWTTVVAVPRSELLAPFYRNLAFVGVGGALVLAATIALAVSQARRISEPVRSLSALAMALNEGRSYVEPVHHIAELDEVRSTLEATMAKSAHLSAIVATSGDAIISVSPDGKILSWNAAATGLFGYSADEAIGQSKLLLAPEDRMGEFAAERSRVLAGEVVHLETVRRHRDGTLIDVLITSAPILRADGRVIALSSVIHDISARKKAEAHIHFLMRELAHRSKNQMAVIQSIAGQTARMTRSPGEFAERFAGRLQGLSASYDLLLAQDWKGVELTDLVYRQIAPFVEMDSPRVEVNGPRVRIDAGDAQSIGLALHELGTNAMKYGAWSSATGKVRIEWSVKEANGASRLQFDWSETGGPRVTPPESKGFGSIVIQSITASALDGTTEIDYAPAGVRWRLEYPLHRNREQS